MKNDTQIQTIFSKRLSQARQSLGYTQAQLGVLAGIDEFSASARVNQYERGVHAPNYGMAERLAAALKVQTSYLFESDDRIAEIILISGKLNARSREKLLVYAKTLLI